MEKTGKKKSAFLRALHLFFVSMWLGSSSCLLFQLLSGLGNADLEQVLGAARLMHWTIVAPSSLGLLITAMLLSITTSVGLFKIPGLAIAYAVTALLIAGDALIFLPNLNGMIDVARNAGSGALVAPAFVSHRNVAAIFLAAQFLFLVIAFFMSIFRPSVGKRQSCAGNVEA